MPEDWPTTIGLMLITAASVGVSVAAVRRVRRSTEASAERWYVCAAIAGVAVALLVYRTLVVHQTWAPLQSHADGLLLLLALVGGIAAHLLLVRRMRGVGLFVGPALGVMGLWGVCASWWTFESFDAQSLWHKLHVVAVYAAAAAVVLTAALGGLFLYVHRLLRRRDDPAASVRLLGRLATLEAIEGWMLHVALAAFVLLSVTLVLGMADTLGRETALGARWYANPKVIGAVGLWVIFALLTHARLAPQLRGKIAAVMSLLGFILLAAVLAMALAGCASIDGTAHAGSDGPDDVNVGVDIQVTPGRGAGGR